MRPFIKYLKENTNNKLTGVEIGVKRGDNASDILEYLNIESLLLVDPWRAYKQASFEELKVGYNKQYIMDEWYNTVKNRFSLNKKVSIFRHTSKFVSDIIIKPVDFVYIDAIHRCENILEDCNLWYKHIKLGGYLCGHDWNNEECSNQVQKAVNEFVNLYKVNLIIINCDWIIKK